MSKFFIERPIFANVIAIITIFLGAVCLYNLLVAQYPQIVPPTIQVTTSFAGASAETVANTIGIPIEQSVNRVKFGQNKSSEASSTSAERLLRIKVRLSNGRLKICLKVRKNSIL